jgi:hypothetical protein
VRHCPKVTGNLPKRPAFHENKSRSKREIKNPEHATPNPVEHKYTQEATVLTQAIDNSQTTDIGEGNKTKIATEEHGLEEQAREGRDTEPIEQITTEPTGVDIAPTPSPSKQTDTGDAPDDLNLAPIPNEEDFPKLPSAGK